MIKTKSRNYASDSKKIRSVTRMPGAFLRIKGRIDARCGQGVCDAYISKLRSRLAAVESREVACAENELFSLRKEAAAILTSLPEKMRKLRELEEVPERTDGMSIEEIRLGRKNAEKRDALEADIHLALESLTSINETITNTESILEERIHRARNLADAKIESYISGVRSGRQSGYRMTSPADDRARESYRMKHEMLDGKIRTIVYRSMYGEGEHEFI